MFLFLVQKLAEHEKANNKKKRMKNKGCIVIPRQPLIIRSKYFFFTYKCLHMYFKVSSYCTFLCSLLIFIDTFPCEVIFSITQFNNCTIFQYINVS